MRTPQTVGGNENLSAGEKAVLDARNLLKAMANNDAQMAKIHAEKDILGPAQPQFTPMKTDGTDTSENFNSVRDSDEFVVLHYGTVFSMRGQHGRYLTAAPMAPFNSNLNSTSVQVDTTFDTSIYASATSEKLDAGSALSYFLSVDGQGVGEEFDGLVFVNPDNRDDTGPICYGMPIAVKAPAAKEKFLGVRDGRIGFWRNLIGKAEKWVVYKCSSATFGFNSVSSSARGIEERNSRGTFLRIGK